MVKRNQESLYDMLDKFQNAGLIKARWDKKVKDWVPYYTPLGAAIARFMRTYNRFPENEADDKQVNAWFKLYAAQEIFQCPKCGSRNFWPVSNDKNPKQFQYFNHWCEDCKYEMEGKD